MGKVPPKMASPLQQHILLLDAPGEMPVLGDMPVLFTSKLVAVVDGQSRLWGNHRVLL